LFVRHNEIRDSIAHLLKGICHDVCIEPQAGLLPLNGESMSHHIMLESAEILLLVLSGEFHIN